MLEMLQMFLLLFKSKYRQKVSIWGHLLSICLIAGVAGNISNGKCTDSVSCNGNGDCRNESCVCYDGWQGSQCQFCEGKISLDALNGNTSVCKVCDNYTKGTHCEECIEGYWGNPVNGGICQPCDCNGQATQCHPETGRCYCTTKGLAGDHCEKCDAMNHYHGDPTNKGSCYYDLTIDYQFTFNLSKKEDRHYTQINFKNSPTKPDIDTDFMIICSVNAKMNITIKRMKRMKNRFSRTTPALILDINLLNPNTALVWKTM